MIIPKIPAMTEIAFSKESASSPSFLQKALTTKKTKQERNISPNISKHITPSLN
ncbi:hypothetical protein [Bacillus rhizoplanae]|uniref:hypothetical protein n=1 Tax=Bacillus rhizoplanae TaxID=2880966 RepID=UPI003D1A637D